MKKQEFETLVLKLWMTTQISLTRAHVQYYTGANRRQLNRWLDELVVDGVLDVDVDDSGEMLWTVPGAERAAKGPTSFAHLEKLNKLKGEVSGNRSLAVRNLESKAALTLAREGSHALAEKPKEGGKSVLLSSGLSVFLGPLGWLYAAPMKEALPAALAFLVLFKLVPSFLLMPLLFVMLPVSGLGGLVYAWQYNRKGKRTPIFTGDGADEDD